MVTFGSLAWAVAVLGSGVATELASGSQLTARSGLMAVEANQRSTPSMEVGVDLLSGIRARSKRTSFDLRYHPRIYYQAPNVADRRLPLYVHQLSAGYQSSLTERTSLSLNANATAGEVSYASLLRSFAGGTAAQSAGIQPLFYYAATLSASHIMSRRHSFQGGVTSGYRVALGGEAEQSQFPTAQDFGLHLSDQLVLSKTDSLSTVVGLSHVIQEDDLPGRLNSSNANLTASWAHALGQQSSVGASVGVGVNWTNRTDRVAVFPLASVNYGKVIRQVGVVWTTALRAGSDLFFDPILATFRPQALVSASLNGQHGRHANSEIGISLATSLGPPVSPAQYETRGNLTVGGSVSNGRGISLHPGITWQLRAPHLSQPDALVLQNELYGFISLRFTVGTDHQDGSWL